MLSMMDNKEERKAFLEHTYGRGSVTEDSHGLIVKGKDGKPLRASSSFFARMAGDAPETTLGIVGALEGAAGGSVVGPAGTFVGAVGGAIAGAASGKTLKEGAKAVTGNYRKTPGQYARVIAGAAEAGAEGEVGGRAIGPVLSRFTRGPIPSKFSGATPEIRKMTEDMLNKGARPPPTSSMPDAIAIQRAHIIADKLTGKMGSMNKANKGYLHAAADKLLDKAGVKRSTTRKSIVEQMQGDHPAIETQATGQAIQQAALTKLHSITGSKQVGGRKIEAYLKSLSANSRSPEDAYNWLVHGGQTDRLDQFIRIMGKNSPVVEQIQQQALRHAFAGAMEEVSKTSGMTGLTKWMNQFTEKQQKLLFPGGLDQDLRTLDKEIKFLFPEIHDPNIAGMATGSMMQKRFYIRWFHQGVAALYRGFLVHPAVMRRLAVGFKGDSAQRKAARAGLKELFYFGALEASEPDLDKDQKK